MFCPKCATQNVEGASFCRACGANIGLVAQALTGQLPAATKTDDLEPRRRRRNRHERGSPSMENGIARVFMGIGFIIAGIAVMMKFPGGFTWGWALFIPGFSSLGKGIASIVAARSNKAALAAPLNSPVNFIPATNVSAPKNLSRDRVPGTGELMRSVPSVTEGTTRHLGAEAPTRHFDPSIGEEKPG